MEVWPRQRRVHNEWELLQALEQKNPFTLRVLERIRAAEDDAFHFRLDRTSGIVIRDGAMSLVRSHLAELRLPRFFPSVPIEAKLADPVFHPNVDPQSGFVCLWDRFSAGDTVMEAVRRLQLVISWKLYNLETEQVIQPAAARWFRNPNRNQCLPLEFMPLVEVESFLLMKTAARRAPGVRRRLDATF
jgi:hypothetical protein